MARGTVVEKALASRSHILPPYGSSMEQGLEPGQAHSSTSRGRAGRAWRWTTEIVEVEDEKQMTGFSRIAQHFSETDRQEAIPLAGTRNSGDMSIMYGTDAKRHREPVMDGGSGLSLRSDDFDSVGEVCAKDESGNWL